MSRAYVYRCRVKRGRCSSVGNSCWLEQRVCVESSGNRFKVVDGYYYQDNKEEFRWDMTAIGIHVRRNVTERQCYRKLIWLWYTKWVSEGGGNYQQNCKAIEFDNISASKSLFFLFNLEWWLYMNKLLVNIVFIEISFPIKEKKKTIPKRDNKTWRDTLKQCGTYFFGIFEADSYHFTNHNFTNRSEVIHYGHWKMVWRLFRLKQEVFYQCDNWKFRDLTRNGFYYLENRILIEGWVLSRKHQTTMLPN
jgi:hypothetical protein